MDIDQTEANIIIISNKNRIGLFYRIYKKTILLFIIPLLALPIAFIGDNNAYLCFYVFLVTSAFWIFDVLHPAVTSLIPVVMSTVINIFGHNAINFINIGNPLLDCFGMLMFIVAIEDSKIHERIALKILLIFGCLHYRLCFLIFFTTMLLSMWISNTVACGFMIPLVKAIMIELEKMGILDIYENIGNSGSRSTSEIKSLRTRRPTDFTVFYFLGIAYSSSIGGMATMVGGQTNQIFKLFSESLFPLGPKIEFPQFMLLTLPGVLILETVLYFWMNFYFLGWFRIHNYSALQTGTTEEEALYTKTLLQIQYEKLGKITAKEMIICFTAMLCALLQMVLSMCLNNNNNLNGHIQTCAPTILCLFILFVAPKNLDCLKFCKKRTASSCTIFEALKQSHMTDEFEKLLLVFGSWCDAAKVLVVVVLCKILTEFASNSCVIHCMMEHIVRMSVASQVNPHSLMLAATLSCSLPFHLITATPAHAMVTAYFNIPHRRMICAGIGPSLISIIVVWFTVTVWAKAIWTDIDVFPTWATTYNVTKVLN